MSVHSHLLHKLNRIGTNFLSSHIQLNATQKTNKQKTATYINFMYINNTSCVNDIVSSEKVGNIAIQSTCD